MDPGVSQAHTRWGMLERCSHPTLLKAHTWSKQTGEYLYIFAPRHVSANQLHTEGIARVSKYRWGTILLLTESEEVGTSTSSTKALVLSTTNNVRTNHTLSIISLAPGGYQRHEVLKEYRAYYNTGDTSKGIPFYNSVSGRTSNFTITYSSQQVILQLLIRANE